MTIFASTEPADAAAEALAAQKKRAVDFAMSAAWAITQAFRIAGSGVDRLRLHDAVTQAQPLFLQLAQAEASGTPENPGVRITDWQACLKQVALDAGAEAVEFQEKPDEARLPALTWVHGAGWALIRGLNASHEWMLETSAGKLIHWPEDLPLHTIRLVVESHAVPQLKKPVFRLFFRTFLSQKKAIVEAMTATVLINLLALIVSLYSMQVYDRVIPTQGYSTLLVLTLGVGLALVFDIVVKLARSNLMEHAVEKIDQKLSREIFGRLLNVRLDQLPSSVGSLSAQMRGYETVRGFLSASTSYALVDAPFGLFFILMIALIGSPFAALVPLFFLLVSLAFGFVMRDKVDASAAQANSASNLKTGLLVEAIEGAETIKSGAGGWKVLSRWIDTNDAAMHHDKQLRRISEKSGYVSAMLQQVSYVGLIGLGAYLAAEGHMTMGALIACSILSGRAMAPMTMLPGLIVQAAHAKAALEMLEKVYALETDNHGVDRPLVPEKIQGAYALERVRFAYAGSPHIFTVPSLNISPGEKVGVVGPIGAGKSTLLRLLSGLYRVNEGRIMLDGLDIDQISHRFLGEKIGYFQQEHRLFNGTLRDNLLIGIPDTGDEVIKTAAARTGLLAAVASHPKGLELPIAEGGKGLSGGQRQLVALTRLLISKPEIWLLDEPTASMDSTTESRCLQVLQEEIQPEHTLVLVTHKPSLLGLVDRLVVIAQDTVVMDGPRDEVIKKLSAPLASDTDKPR